MENLEFSLKSSRLPDLSPWMEGAMEFMSPGVCRPVLIQARAQSNKQGVTWISKWEELSLWWLLRRYVGQMNYMWRCTGRQNKQKSIQLTFFKLPCRYRVIQNADRTSNLKNCNDYEVNSHRSSPMKLQLNPLIYISPSPYLISTTSTFSTMWFSPPQKQFLHHLS